MPVTESNLSLRASARVAAVISSPDFGEPLVASALIGWPARSPPNRTSAQVRSGPLWKCRNGFDLKWKFGGAFPCRGGRRSGEVMRQARRKSCRDSPAQRCRSTHLVVGTSTGASSVLSRPGPIGACSSPAASLDESHTHCWSSAEAHLRLQSRAGFRCRRPAARDLRGP
jgi:hypothetical protein